MDAHFRRAIFTAPGLVSVGTRQPVCDGWLRHPWLLGSMLMDADLCMSKPTTTQRVSSVRPLLAVLAWQVCASNMPSCSCLQVAVPPGLCVVQATRCCTHLWSACVARCAKPGAWQKSGTAGLCAQICSPQHPARSWSRPTPLPACGPRPPPGG